nr:hypothetical protein [uncultured Fluviicola sp.]
MSKLKLPERSEFFINTSPYSSFELNEEDKDLIFEIVYGINTIDCYCISCKSLSVFTPEDKRPQTRLGRQNGHLITISRSEDWNEVYMNWNRLIERKFFCSRDNNHVMYHFLLVKDKEIQKIGQFPSLADINAFEIKKYKKTLGDIYFKEFNKAIGLFSHGIGVGSYVYLRRIIENFIVKPAYDKAKTGATWDEDLYQKSRVREKMSLLKNHLPNFLIENTILYSIISKGIHELNEEDCLKYFPIIKSSIELLLIELEEERKIKEKKTEIARQLASIAVEIK